MTAAYSSSPEGLTALESALTAGLAQFMPPRALSLSEWADQFAVLSREDSAQPGKFQTASAEYQRGAMDAITDPAIENIVLKWASQTGKILFWVDYYRAFGEAPWKPGEGPQ